MRSAAVAVLLLFSAAAFAQEQPKQEPPKPPAPQPAPAQQAPSQAAPAQAAPPQPAPAKPKIPQFVGATKIRTADGLLVGFYRVNYVDAALLQKELEKWKTPKAVITAEGPTYATPEPPEERRKSLWKLAGTPAVQTTLRIEETEENWPVLEHILEIVDVPQAQVYVEARISESTYDDDLRVGVEAHVTRPLGDTLFQAADVKFPNRLTAEDQFTTTFKDVQKYYTFQYLLDLAESGATTTVIAKPGVYVGQGETATIKVGDKEPIVQQQLAANVVTATTVLQDTGLRLEVQPLLIGRDGVRARISAEVSRVSDFRVTATSTNLQVVNPVISTRNADTVVTVRDGDTVTIAGLDQDVTRDESTGIPLLKDLPLVGYLFGSTTKRKQRTEVVFFITFEILLNPGEGRLIEPPAENGRPAK